MLPGDSAIFKLFRVQISPRPLPSRKKRDLWIGETFLRLTPWPFPPEFPPKSKVSSEKIGRIKISAKVSAKNLQNRLG